MNLGLSWFNGKSIRKIAIDPSTSTTLYASVTGSGSHSIWKSTDSGTYWTQKRGPTTGAGGVASTFYDIVIDPNSTSTVYVTAPDGVFKSTDGGTNWSQTSLYPIPEPAAPSFIAFRNVAGVPTLYLAFQALRCQSCNQTCREIPTIVKSTDGGSSWTLPLPSSDSCDGSELYCFNIDPAHPERIFVGGAGVLRYSLDGGNIWTSSQNNVHVDMHAIVFCPTNSQRNYLGSDGGIYRSDNGGTGNPITWSSKNQNLPASGMNGISISKDDHMVMGNQDNGTQLGWAGRNPPWQEILSGDGWKPKIDQNDSNKLYYCDYVFSPLHSGNKAPMRWINGNQTNVTPTGAYGECSQFFPIMFVAPSDSNRVIMGFQNVWRSTDSGDSWMRIGGHPSAACGTLTACPNPGIDSGCRTITSVYEAPTDTNVIYAVADYAKVYVTSDANQWTDRTAGTPGGGINAVIVDPTNSNTAYIACNSNVYKTTNSGSYWMNLNIPRSTVYSDVAIDPANPQHIFVASYVGVYTSTDGGGTWANGSLGIPSGMKVTSFSFNATSRQLAASVYGRGAYILDLDDVPPTVSITAPPSGATVSGTVTVSANAADNHRVVGVQFKLDNSNLGNEDTSSPYSIGWNTTTATNGLHALRAVARDPAGNITTSAWVTVTVSN